MSNASEISQAGPQEPSNIAENTVVRALVNPTQENRLFWYICGNDGEQEPRATPLLHYGCQFEFEISAKRYSEILAEQYKVYQTVRGRLIDDMIRDCPAAEEVIKQHYVFLKPFQSETSNMSSSQGYWVHLEHDVFRTDNLDHLSSLPMPEPTSSFPWSRVRNIHLPEESLVLDRFEQAVHHVPNVKNVCVLYPAYNLLAAFGKPGTNPHTATMESLKRIEGLLVFEDQASLANVSPMTGSRQTSWPEPGRDEPQPPLPPREKPSRDTYSNEVKEVLQWCQSKDIGIIEVLNRCPRCCAYNRPDFARRTTQSNVRRYRSPQRDQALEYYKREGYSPLLQINLVRVPQNL